MPRHSDNVQKPENTGKELAMPHDALFRFGMQVSEAVVATLRVVLPPELKVLLSHELLLLEPETLINKNLNRRQVDILIKTQWRKNNDHDNVHTVYILIEHKSYPDPHTPTQMLNYMSAILDKHTRTTSDPGGNLPLIIPLVFYTGSHNWKVPTSTFDGINIDKDIQAHCLNIHYMLINLAEVVTDEPFDSPLAWASLRTIIICQRKAMSEDILYRILKVAKENNDLVFAILQYIVKQSEITIEAIKRSLSRIDPEGWRTKMGTLADQWLEQGKKEGMLKGIMEGKKEGMLKGKKEGMLKGIIEGKIETLLTQINLKFGQLPEKYTKVVHEASVDQIDVWLRAVVTAPRLEDIFKTSHLN